VRLRFLIAHSIGLALLAGAGGCHKASPVAPDAPFSGTFAGTITDKAAGAGTLELRLSQSEAVVSGQWRATFANAALSQAGTVRGTAINTSVTLSLIPDTGLDCGAVSYDATLTVAATLSKSRLEGTYVVFTCTALNTGRIDVERQ
jgi:hypothetical protein